MTLARFLALAVVGFPVSHAAPAPDTPNFVVIFIDDMGYADIGPFGAAGSARRISTAWRRRA